MTDQELRQSIADLLAFQKETAQQMRETDERMKETDRSLKEMHERTRRELREEDQRTRRELKEADQRTRRELQEMAERTDRFLKESSARVDRQLEELGKQIGGLGNKFGDFAEGMAIPSVIEILAKRFDADQIVETNFLRKGADEIELDFIAATNGDQKTVVAAEVKSSLNRRELERFVRNLERFLQFFPQFKGYKLYGLLAAVKSRKDIEAAAAAQGIFLAKMHGDIFRVQERPNFAPRDFSV